MTKRIMNISEYSDNHPSKRNKITKENFIDLWSPTYKLIKVTKIVILIMY
jgi:hypothetical protein